jgi:hypothetical protein
MGYMVLEAIIVALLETGGGLFADSRTLFPGHNVGALIAENRFGGLEYESMAFRDLGQSDAGVWTATMILVAESALLIAVSFAVFMRRDVTVNHG